MEIDKLNRAKKLKNDEFYTLYDDVKKIFFEFRNYVKGKKLYLPFDSSDSNFVKYLKQNKKSLNVEFKYTNDDYKNNLDLFKWCDLVISNPPFSILNSKLYSFFEENNVDFILITPIILGKKWYHGNINFYNLKINKFINDSNEIKEVRTYVSSNIFYKNIFLKKCIHENNEDVLFKKYTISKECPSKHNVYIPLGSLEHLSYINKYIYVSSPTPKFNFKYFKICDII